MLKRHWRSLLWVVVFVILAYVVITLQNENNTTHDLAHKTNMLAQANRALTLQVQANAQAAYENTCNGRNSDRMHIIKFVNTLEANSRRNAQATEASATATPAQKQAAAANLAAVARTDAALRAQFAPLDCTYPTKTPVPTTSTTSTTVG